MEVYSVKHSVYEVELMTELLKRSLITGFVSSQTFIVSSQSASLVFLILHKHFPPVWWWSCHQCLDSVFLFDSLAHPETVMLSTSACSLHVGPMYETPYRAMLKVYNKICSVQMFHVRALTLSAWTSLRCRPQSEFNLNFISLDVLQLHSVWFNFI